MKPFFTKPPFTFERQLDRLIERGLICDDRQLALRYLEHINYYRLAAYCLHFEEVHATHVFRSGTRFEDVLNLYVFDRELRLLVMDAIERVEVSIRTRFAYELAHRYGTHFHLKASLFKKPTPGKHWDHGEQIQKLIHEANKSQETFVKHFQKNYAEPLPPVWATTELMTLGELSKWYDNLKSGADRNAVAHRYDLDETCLTSFLHHLSTVRNICAHHARLWNREFTFAFILPRRPLALAKSLNPLKGKHLYNTLSVLAWMMDCISPHHSWKIRLKELFERHEMDTQKMGFPSEWETFPVWLPHKDEGTAK